MADVLVDQGWPLICRGIQHPTLSLFAQDPTNRSFCCERWSCISNVWRSKDCQLFTNLSSLKQRCPKCANAHSNIRYNRVPELYPERRAIESAANHEPEPVPEQRTVSARELICSDESALRQRMAELLVPVDETNDLPADPKAALAIKMSMINDNNRINEKHVWVLPLKKQIIVYQKKLTKSEEFFRG